MHSLVNYYKAKLTTTALTSGDRTLLVPPPTPSPLAPSNYISLCPHKTEYHPTFIVITPCISL